MTTTPSTIQFEPGAVVRVQIRFTSGQGIKRRPALVLTDATYHGSRADAIVMALSSKMDARYHGDCDLTDWKTAGLPKPTKVKAVLETIDRASVDHQYGSLSGGDLQRVRTTLREVLGL